VPGGEALGTLENGKKILAWGGLPGELVRCQVLKSKSGYERGVVTEVLEKSEFRVETRDDESYLSTSPWQILNYDYELQQKSELIREAFRQEKIEIATPEVATDGREYEYRNKMEFGFWWDNETGRVSLAFYRRGTHGKIPVEGSSLAGREISEVAGRVVDLLNELGVEARSLKTLMMRKTASGEVFAQLYVKEVEGWESLTERVAELGVKDFEIIYSDPKSPASVVTQKLFSLNETMPSDELLGMRFQYAVEGFFQINLSVYEMVLAEIRELIETEKVVDLYSGVGTIGLTVANDKNLTLVEVDEAAGRELKENAAKLATGATVMIAKSEEALEFVDEEATVIVDPPRAGLHKALVERLLEVQPPIVIYLSCNPTTQARDVKILLEGYEIASVKGYNFFPRTPHIENLVVLRRK